MDAYRRNDIFRLAVLLGTPIRLLVLIVEAHFARNDGEHDLPHRTQSFSKKRSIGKKEEKTHIVPISRLFRLGPRRYRIRHAPHTIRQHLRVLRNLARLYPYIERRSRLRAFLLRRRAYPLLRGRPRSGTLRSPPLLLLLLLEFLGRRRDVRLRGG